MEHSKSYMEQPKIYISYSWEEKSKAIATEIEFALFREGIVLHRDQNEVNYKGRIDHFMDEMGQGDLIILLIGKDYLQSEYCMYELLQIHKNKNDFEDRIFPILLPTAEIHKAKKRVDYTRFWQKEHKELDETIRAGDITDTPMEDLRRYRDIAMEVGSLTLFLSKLNAQSIDHHRYTKYEDLINAIKSRLKVVKGGNNTSTNSPEEDHSHTQPHTSSTTSPVALKSEIKQLITRGNMDKAFDRLQQVISNDSRHANVLLGLQSQYSSLSRDNRIGILSNSEYSVQNNRITYNLISVVDDLEDEDLK